MTRPPLFDSIKRAEEQQKEDEVPSTSWSWPIQPRIRKSWFQEGAVSKLDATTALKGMEDFYEDPEMDHAQTLYDLIESKNTVELIALLTDMRELSTKRFNESERLEKGAQALSVIVKGLEGKS